MQGSHTHIPGTNHVPTRYIVAAILSLMFMVPLCLVPALALLFFYVSTFRSMCAVPIIIIIIIINTKSAWHSNYTNITNYSTFEYIIFLSCRRQKRYFKATLVLYHPFMISFKQ